MANQNSKEEKQKRTLEALRRKEEEESTQLLAKKYGLTYVNLSIYPIETDALKLVSENSARLAEIIVFQRAGTKLKIAVRNPEKNEIKTILERLKEERFSYELFLASKYGIEHGLKFYSVVPEQHYVLTGTVELAPEEVERLGKEVSNLTEISKHIEEAFFKRTTQALDTILAGALAVDASDIHIEPQESSVRLRFRIDGVLYDVLSIPTKLYITLLSRIKLISELKLNIRDRAQDGRFTIRLGETDMEVRTSTLPGPNGENVVLRVLNPKSIAVQFSQLGMQPWVGEAMEAELKKPNGMILTTGPTGSGKTTTLYAFLLKIHTPEIKIITIEDPIEYHLKGIEQTQVDTGRGYDFATGLRAIVRQDPDVILVGEIRDFETAETAMHAALTGHLVFSTLHTNSAVGTIPRLVDLGVKPSIIAPAINITMAQRLVRRLCAGCRKQVKITGEEKKKIEKELKGFPPQIPIPSYPEWTTFQAAEKGCALCSGMGYKGRVGIFEIILVSEGFERLILKDPTEFEIKKEATRQGQITMKQDGILKVLAGTTDLAELKRVVGSE